MLSAISLLNSLTGLSRKGYVIMNVNVLCFWAGRYWACVDKTTLGIPIILKDQDQAPSIFLILPTAHYASCTSKWLLPTHLQYQLVRSGLGSWEK